MLSHNESSAEFLDEDIVLSEHGDGRSDFMPFINCGQLRQSAQKRPKGAVRINAWIIKTALPDWWGSNQKSNMRHCRHGGVAVRRQDTKVIKQVPFKSQRSQQLWWRNVRRALWGGVGGSVFDTTGWFDKMWTNVVAGDCVESRRSRMEINHVRYWMLCSVIALQKFKGDQSSVGFLAQTPTRNL
jgi:hypothetical protein